MRKIEIICDYCLKNITFGSLSEEYRIVLKSEEKWYREDLPVCDMIPFPPEFDKDHYFCHWTCLKNWVINRKGKFTGK